MIPMAYDNDLTCDNIYHYITWYFKFLLIYLNLKYMKKKKKNWIVPTLHSLYMVITTSHLMVIIDPWVLYLQKEYEYCKMIQKLTSSRITDTNIPSLTETE